MLAKQLDNYILFNNAEICCTKCKKTYLSKLKIPSLNKNCSVHLNRTRKKFNDRWHHTQMNPKNALALMCWKTLEWQRLGATRQNPVRDQNPLLQRPHFSNWRPSVVIKRSCSKWLFTILVLICNGTLQLVFYHKLFTIIDWPAMVCSCDRICQRMRRKRTKS